MDSPIPIVRIVRAGDWVRATPEGHLDRAAAERLLAEVMAAAAGLTTFAVVLDLRRVRAHLSVFDLWHLARHLEELPALRTRKVAILPPAAGSDADFFTVAAQNRGLTVRAFADFEAAVDWLTEGRPAEDGR